MVEDQPSICEALGSSSRLTPSPKGQRERKTGKAKRETTSGLEETKVCL